MYLKAFKFMNKDINATSKCKICNIQNKLSKKYVFFTEN